VPWNDVLTLINGLDTVVGVMLVCFAVYAWRRLHG